MNSHLLAGFGRFSPPLSELVGDATARARNSGPRDVSHQGWWV